MKNIINGIQYFVEKILNIVLIDILQLKLEDKERAELSRFIKFGIVGFSNTVLGYIIYIFSLFFLRKVNLFCDIDYLVAQIIMFILTTLWAFYWNSKWVFKKKYYTIRNVFFALIKIYMSYAFINLFVSTVLLILVVDVIGISEYIAPLITLFITIPLNFIIQKLWIFS